MASMYSGSLVCSGPQIRNFMFMNVALHLTGTRKQTQLLSNILFFVCFFAVVSKDASLLNDPVVFLRVVPRT